MSETHLIKIHLDLETYSEADLLAIGAHKYAADPSTDVLTASFAIGPGRVQRWRPGDDVPACLRGDYDLDEIEIHAWNSQFERLLWWRVLAPVYGWPHMPLEAFVCTSAQGRVSAAGPAKLDTAGQFFDRRHLKDMKGHRHMLYMCKPAPEKDQLDWIAKGERDLLLAVGATAEELRDAQLRCHHTPKNLDKLHAYNDVDVETERDIARILPEWRADDLEAFWESERINDRGLVVDVDFAQAAAEYAEDEKAYYAQRIAEITGNEVTTPRQFQRIAKWALPRMSPQAVKITEWYDEGVKKNSFDSDTRANLLAECARDADFMAEDVTEFIEVMDAAGKSTISKYQAIANRAFKHDGDRNMRVHGLYMYAGAPQSGRYSSTGIQAHNLVRNVPDNAPALIKAFKSGERLEVEHAINTWAAGVQAKGRKASYEPIHALGQLVRPTITGCKHGDFDLVWGDWASVEAVTLPWLTLDPDAEDRLAVFRRGEDIYLRTASAILGREVTKEDEAERQAYGKVPELSLGYLGGAGAFAAMAKNYGVRLEEKEILRIVKNWRDANPWAMRFGENAERAAMLAIRRPGVSFSAGRLNYVYEPDALDGIGALFCELPSGRRLCYPNAAIDVVKTKWGKEKPGITAMKSAWRPKKGEKEWPRVSVWPGLLVENATQAACADLLNIALRRASEKPWRLKVCAHTHDEIVIESADPERDAVRLRELMTTRPGWQGDDRLPLRADVGHGYRYKVKTEMPKPQEAKAA